VTELVALTLSLPYFAVMAVILLLAGIALALVTAKPTRSCPLCERPMTLDRRRCKYCGHDLTSFYGVH
jgi:predicted amidophosphoribosyltransferase